MFRVLNTLLDERIGGPQLRVLSIAKGLRKKSIETIILIPKGDNNYANVARKGDFKVYQLSIRKLQELSDFKSIINNLIYILKLPIMILNMYKIIQKEKIDIVHANGVLNIHSLIAAFLSRSRLVYHLNDIKCPKIAKSVLIPFIAKISDSIIIVADAVGEYYFGKEFPDNVTTIHAPVDLERFNPQKINNKNLHKIKETLQISKDNFIVGCIGNINPAKGYEYFLDAAFKVIKKIPNTTFIIAGAAINTRKEYYNFLLEKRSALDLGKKVKFTGYREDIPEIISLLDILVLPSRWEACPQSILEGMAMRKPVVTTKVGGVPEQVDDKKSGLIVPPEEPNELSRAVISLLENLERGKEMGNEGRRKVKERFSLEKCVEKHAEVYNNIINIK